MTLSEIRTHITGCIDSTFRISTLDNGGFGIKTLLLTVSFSYNLEL